MSFIQDAGAPFQPEPADLMTIVRSPDRARRRLPRRSFLEVTRRSASGNPARSALQLGNERAARWSRRRIPAKDHPH